MNIYILPNKMKYLNIFLNENKEKIPISEGFMIIEAAVIPLTSF